MRPNGARRGIDPQSGPSIRSGEAAFVRFFRELPAEGTPLADSKTRSQHAFVARDQGLIWFTCATA